MELRRKGLVMGLQVSFPRPRPTLPAWLLTAHVTPTREQLARLGAALNGTLENPSPRKDA